MEIGAVLVKYATSLVQNALSAQGASTQRKLHVDSANLRRHFEVIRDNSRALIFVYMGWSLLRKGTGRIVESWRRNLQPYERAVALDRLAQLMESLTIAQNFLEKRHATCHVHRSIVLNGNGVFLWRF